jgi:hypothetical protein
MSGSRAVAWRTPCSDAPRRRGTGNLRRPSGAGAPARPPGARPTPRPTATAGGHVPRAGSTPRFLDTGSPTRPRRLAGRARRGHAWRRGVRGPVGRRRGTRSGAAAAADRALARSRVAAVGPHRASAGQARGALRREHRAWRAGPARRPACRGDADVAPAPLLAAIDGRGRVAGGAAPEDRGSEERCRHHPAPHGTPAARVLRGGHYSGLDVSSTGRMRIPKGGSQRQKGCPGQSFSETVPGGQCHPETSQTGEVVTSFAHPPTQHTRVNPGESSHTFPVPAS